ncbi:GNAT family N-acetyltransferase [Terrisporobacter sp.]
MSLVIRNIKESDYDEVEALTREAFWNVYRPGCGEHLVVHNIHKYEKSIKELELVALYDNKIVGHIVYTKGHVTDSENDNFISFGPISVLPEFQNESIGSKLIRISLQKAARLGYDAVFITGNNDYYNRFGFESASKYGVHMQGVALEDEAEFFMVKILKKDALKDVLGYFIFDECYHVDEAELENFDQQFPFKVMEIKEGQLNI